MTQDWMCLFYHIFPKNLARESQTRIVQKIPQKLYAVQGLPESHRESHENRPVHKSKKLGTLGEVDVRSPRAPDPPRTHDGWLGQTARGSGGVAGVSRPRLSARSVTPYCNILITDGLLCNM
jgi:hypothetical protein